MQEPFWVTDPAILVRNYTQLFPTSDMTRNGRYNAFARLIIILGLVALAILQRYEVALLTALTLAASVAAYYLTSSGMPTSGVHSVSQKAFPRSTTFDTSFENSLLFDDAEKKQRLQSQYVALPKDGVDRMFYGTQEIPTGLHQYPLPDQTKQARQPDFHNRPVYDKDYFWSNNQYLYNTSRPTHIYPS